MSQLNLFDILFEAPILIHRLRGSALQTLSLPVGPLVAAVQSRGRSLKNDLLGPNLAGAYHRALRRGTITPLLADRIAVRCLHMHPSEIWPQWWLIGTEAAA